MLATKIHDNHFKIDLLTKAAVFPLSVVFDGLQLLNNQTAATNLA